MRSQNLGERLGMASKRSSLSRHSRLYLPNPGVQSEARPRSRDLQLAEPTLKLTKRRTKVVQEWTWVRTNIIYQLSETRWRRFASGILRLGFASLRLGGRPRATRARRMRTRGDPPCVEGWGGTSLRGGGWGGTNAAEGWGAASGAARGWEAAEGPVYSWRGILPPWSSLTFVSVFRLVSSRAWNIRLSPAVTPGWGEPASGLWLGRLDGWGMDGAKDAWRASILANKDSERVLTKLLSVSTWVCILANAWGCKEGTETAGGGGETEGLGRCFEEPFRFQWLTHFRVQMNLLLRPLYSLHSSQRVSRLQS